MKYSFRFPRDDFSRMKGFKRLNGAIFSLSYGSIPGRNKGAVCVVSSKTAPRAVDRNRIKRLCRAAFSDILEHNNTQYVYVCIAKKQALAADYTAILADLSSLIAAAR